MNYNANPSFKVHRLFIQSTCEMPTVHLFLCIVMKAYCYWKPTDGGRIGLCVHITPKQQQQKITVSLQISHRSGSSTLVLFSVLSTSLLFQVFSLCFLISAFLPSRLICHLCNALPFLPLSSLPSYSLLLLSLPSLLYTPSPSSLPSFTLPVSFNV